MWSVRVQAGKAGKKGMHSGKDAPVHHVNNVAIPGSAARAKQYLPFLSRGKIQGVVEQVVNGHRYKVRTLPHAGLCVRIDCGDCLRGCQRKLGN